MLGFKWLHKKIRNPDTGEVYLERWEIGFRTAWSLKLHHIWKKDFGRALHDHPWPFTSLILWGGYKEHLYRPRVTRPSQSMTTTSTPKNTLLGAGSRDTSTRARHRVVKARPFQLVRRGLMDRHRIDEVTSPCWTFVVCGKRQRVWGFWLDDDTWVPHTMYLNAGTETMTG